MSTRFPPLPDEVSARDEERRELGVVVFVLGDGAEEFLREVHSATSPSAERRVVSVASPHDLSAWLVLPVRLGAIRGWTPTLFLYGMADSTQVERALETYGRCVMGLVLTDKTPRIAELSGRLSRLLRDRPTLPFVVFGSNELGAKASAAAGRQPSAAPGSDPDHCMPLLKAIFRDALGACGML
jgi:hypothetical protein